ncbi:hypothetical protein E2C01_065905 [Portunus trituberculatus]|uniref:Uncharacterized protein n=1 Tax=Portunus trituberculatus TaxID=210409 RepID=A0A5B7HFT7_PORTR|nr:hypothetical protein [Portunus trituberculatus]
MPFLLVGNLDGDNAQPHQQALRNTLRTEGADQGKEVEEEEQEKEDEDENKGENENEE